MEKEQLRSAGIYTDISPSAVRVCCCDGENEWLTPVVLDVKHVGFRSLIRPVSSEP